MQVFASFAERWVFIPDLKVTLIRFRSGTLENKLRLFPRACSVTMENSCVGEMLSI